ITRRAERLACELSKSEKIHDADKIFLNRLSDYCFLLMRREELNL
ncbi:MAG: ATP:cob(I)alamin adenosyltransferase, partial [Selenomonadaceae bacterium]|nr:ATP:cob(I)alamin adenosyltransferase [Selenomonadaceae bacterium]